MSALVMLGELRAVGAFVTHVVTLRTSLHRRAARGGSCFAKGHSQRDEGRSACGFDTQDRLLLSFPAHTKALLATKLKEQF